MNQRQAAVSRARREIMEAAGAQFAAHGYEGTSFSRVAEAMGKPKSAIGYHLFASKESLAGAVVEDQEDRWLRIEAALDRPGALHERIVFLLTDASTVEVCPVAAGAIRLLQDMPRLGLAVERRFDVWRFTREHLEAELAVRDIRAGDLDAVVDVLLSATFGVLSYRSPRLAEHDSRSACAASGSRSSSASGSTTPTPSCAPPGRSTWSSWRWGARMPPRRTPVRRAARRLPPPRVRTRTRTAPEPDPPRA